MSFEESVLHDAAALAQRDSRGFLYTLATAGAQVRRAALWDADLGALRGPVPRALLIATDAPLAAEGRLIAQLASPAAAAVVWSGADLPGWAGAGDALLIAAADGRHPRLATLAEQGARRGLAMGLAAPAASPVAAAAGRAPLADLDDALGAAAPRWAALTPLLLALDALGLRALAAGELDEIADALDMTATACRPSGELFTNPAKSLALGLADARPVLAGAGVLAGLAARAMAEAIQLASGVGAVAVELPDDVARAGAMLRGAGPHSVDDFFRDRAEDIEDPGPLPARLVVLGDDGSPADPALGQRSDAQLQLGERAARRAAEAVRELAADLGVPVSDVDVPAGSVLARYAAAVAFGEFTAGYLALGLGLDPGAARPAELAH